MNGSINLETTPVDLETIQWSMGSFADLQGKEAVLMVFTDDLFEMDLDYIVAKWDSIEDIQKIIDELLNAKDDPNSGSIGCVQGRVWFVCKDNTGIGFNGGESNEFTLLKDSRKKVRASKELSKVVHILGSKDPYSK